MEAKNTDNIFIRNCIVGMQIMFYETVFIDETVGGKEKKVHIPIFYAKGADEQLAHDLFLDKDKYYKECKVDGNVNKIPSGIFVLAGGGLLPESTGNRRTRSVYKKKVENDVGEDYREFSARTAWIPHKLPFTLTIRCSNEGQRMKVFDKIVELFSFVRKFYISYKEFPKIPCFLEFPADFTANRELKYKYNEKQGRPELEMSLVLYADRPIVDLSTEMETVTRAGSYTVNTRVSNTQ
jgi:hypothetical protein